MKTLNAASLSLLKILSQRGIGEVVAKKSATTQLSRLGFISTRSNTAGHKGLLAAITPVGRSFLAAL